MSANPLLVSRRRALLLAGGTALSTATLPLLPAATASAAASHGDDDQSTALALAWYDLTTQTIAASAFPEPVTASRVWAVSWLAAARAAKRARPRGSAYASAAFAAALHDTLVAQAPSQATQLDRALAATLAALPPGSARDEGVAAGQGAAAAILAERAGDGFDTASIDIAWTPPPAAAGVWQPTPPTFGPAVRAGEGKARAFLLDRNDQFRPGPPPAPTSDIYLSSLTEVRTVGSAAGSTRTAEQTAVAAFWQQNSIDAFVQVVRAAVADLGTSLFERARFVGAFHAITIDAQIAVYETKYTYVFWRPVTAIRTGAVAPDSTWTPYTNTPRHPEYVSGHGGYAGAAQEILQALAGPRPIAPISVTSSTALGATRVYDRWPQITQENIDGRVWEGIHFRFSDEAGVRLGREVARYGLRRLSVLTE